jgi:hypothetical protein
MTDATAPMLQAHRNLLDAQTLLLAEGRGDLQRRLETLESSLVDLMREYDPTVTPPWFVTAAVTYQAEAPPDPYVCATCGGGLRHRWISADLFCDRCKAVFA